jgi:hypothetical protein
MVTSQLTPNLEFGHVASDERIAKTAESLTANGIQTFVVANAEEARKNVFELIPRGAEVFVATSRTLDHIGLLGPLGNDTTWSFSEKCESSVKRENMQLMVAKGHSVRVINDKPLPLNGLAKLTESLTL